MTDRPPVSGEPQCECACIECGGPEDIHCLPCASTGADAPPPLDVESEARFTPAEALDPEQAELIGQSISEIVHWRLLGVRFGNGVSSSTCAELSQRLTAA
jgi:hypothetical protein